MGPRRPQMLRALQRSTTPSDSPPPANGSIEPVAGGGESPLQPGVQNVDSSGPTQGAPAAGASACGADAGLCSPDAGTPVTCVPNGPPSTTFVCRAFPPGRPVLPTIGARATVARNEPRKRWLRLHGLQWRDRLGSRADGRHASRVWIGGAHSQLRGRERRVRCDAGRVHVELLPLSARAISSPGPPAARVGVVSWQARHTRLRGELGRGVVLTRVRATRGGRAR